MIGKHGYWVSGALAAVVLACLPAPASAFCIGWDKSLPNYDPHYYSVSHEFRRANYVIEAQVVQETWLGEDGKPKTLQPPFENGAKKPWGFDPYVGAYYDLRVLRSFKCDAPPMLRLFSENSTARFWFDVGAKQVLFVSHETFEAPVGRSLTMDTCGNSEPLPKAGALLGKLRKLENTPLR